MKAVCLFGWKHILNVLSIIRTADGLGFNEIIITGRKKPPFQNHRKMSMKEFGKIEHKIKYFENPDECTRYLLNNYNLVCVELDQSATPIYQYTWSPDTCIVVGHEREGVPQYLIDISDTIYIPMKNAITCMNVGCCASIAMYDYVNKTNHHVCGDSDPTSVT